MGENCALRVSNPRPRELERQPSPNQPSAAESELCQLRTYCTYTCTCIYQCYPVYSLLPSRHSHRRQSPAWPFVTGWRITPGRNGCGSPRGTQTTGPGGLDQSSASVGSCVPGRSFGRWWRGVHRRHHCWPRVCFPPVLRTLCGRRSCLPSLAVRG